MGKRVAANEKGMGNGKVVDEDKLMEALSNLPPVCPICNKLMKKVRYPKDPDGNEPVVSTMERWECEECGCKCF